MSDKIEVKLHPVNSTNVIKAGYNKEKKVLEIVYQNGIHYQYEGVPDSVVLDMWSSESVGAFIQKHVAKNYPYRKL